MNARPATNETAGREPPAAPAVLRGRRLFFARAAWVALAAPTVGLFVASVPVAYERLGTVCEGASCDFPRLYPEGAKALEGLGLSVGFYAAYSFALILVLALGFWAIGALLFWKRSDNLLVLCASIALVTFGTIQADTLHWLPEAYPRWELPVAYAYFVGEASFFVLFCVFPDGRFVPRWMRWVAIVGIGYWLLDSFFPDSALSPRNWPLIFDASVFLGLIGGLVVAQIYRYRRVSGPIQRQQTKWVVFGFTATIAVFVVVLLIKWLFALTQPGIPQVLYDLVATTILSIFGLLVPLSIGFAILRYRLWDVDIVIRRSLVIGPLATILTVVFELANQLLLPFVFRFIPGLDEESPLNTVVSVVIVVVLFKPLHARIEAGVKRLADRLAGGAGTSESPR